MASTRQWYRVRYEGGKFLGYGLPEPGTWGYPTLVQVLEPEAQCYKDPREAAEVALQARYLPFTIETATARAEVEVIS